MVQRVPVDAPFDPPSAHAIFVDAEFGLLDPPADRLTEWNTVELYAVGQTAVHVVNGKVNMVLTGLRHKVDGKDVPLTNGKIQLQSESAEVYYRDIAVRPLSEIPGSVLER